MRQQLRAISRAERRQSCKTAHHKACIIVQNLRSTKLSPYAATAPELKCSCTAHEATPTRGNNTQVSNLSKSELSESRPSQGCETSTSACELAAATETSPRAAASSSASGAGDAANCTRERKSRCCGGGGGCQQGLCIGRKGGQHTWSTMGMRLYRMMGGVEVRDDSACRDARFLGAGTSACG